MKLLLLASVALFCAVEVFGDFRNPTENGNGQQRPPGPPQPPHPPNPCEFCKHLLENCEGAKELLKCVMEHHNHTQLPEEPQMEKRAPMWRSPPKKDSKHCQMAALEVCHACKKQMKVMEILEKCGVSPPEPPTPGPEPEPMPQPERPMEGGPEPMERADPCEICEMGKEKCPAAEDLIKCIHEQHHHKKEEEEMGSSSSSEESSESESKRAASLDSVEKRDVSSDSVEKRDVSSDSVEKRDVSDSAEKRDVSSDSIEKRDVSDSAEKRDVSSDSVEKRQAASYSAEKRQAPEMEGDCRLPVLHVCHVCRMMTKVKKVFEKCGLKKPEPQPPKPMMPKEKREMGPGEDHMCIMCHKITEHCEGAEEFIKCVIGEHHHHHNKTGEEMITKRQMDMHKERHPDECKLMALGACHECHKRKKMRHIMEECKPEEPTPSP